MNDDDTEQDAPSSHLGWDLYEAARGWDQMFARRMAERGYPVFAEARARLLSLIGPHGISQRALAEASGLTKQAVQQHLDLLVADGLVTRSLDAGDKRQRQISLSPDGLVMMAIADEVRTEIETGFGARIGPARAQRMKNLVHAFARFTRQN